MLTSPPRRLLKTRSAVETEAAKLRHKLSQAIEGARQREGLKKSLDDVKASRDSLAAQNAKLRKEAKEREAGPRTGDPTVESLMSEIESLEQQRDLLIKTKDRLGNQIVEKEEMSNKTMQEVRAERPLRTPMELRRAC